MEGTFSTRTKISVVITLLIVVTSFQAQAKRWGLAKKYQIPPMSESEISMGQSTEAELDPKSIKVFVWNLLKAERKNWREDFINLTKDKDILMLQEGYLNNTMKSAFDLLTDFRFDMAVSFLYKKDNNTPTGTILGSRVSPIDVGNIRTRDLEPFIKTPKTMTYGKYPIAGAQKDLMVLNIHGINFTKHHTFVNQINQAIEYIVAHDGPVIFAGDFNTRTNKRLQHLKDVMKFLGFKEVSFRNDRRMRAAKIGPKLDHAFVRDLLVKDSYVLGNIKTSDHKALVMELVYDHI